MAGAVVERVHRVAITDRDQGVCGICWQCVPAPERSLDHIIPLSRGGAHVPENIQLAHKRCNSLKGTKLMQEMERLG
jgi:5-methylcytosine-specific restriction endonuclease McrA